MSHLPVVKKARRRLASLGRDDGGAVAIIFALVALVIIGATFGVLDVTRASNTRQALRDALDAATLAAARSGATDNAALKAVGDRYLQAEITRLDIQTLTSDFKLDGQTVVGSAKGSLKPIVLGLFIKGSMPVNAETHVIRDNTLSTEIVMVLDTTLSMQGAKITTLKAAAKDLVQKVMKGSNGQVKVAIVPFADYVNIGVSRRNEPWVDVPADYNKNNPGGWGPKNETTCKVPGKPYTCTKYSDGIPNHNATCYTAATDCTTITKQVYTEPSVTPYVFTGCIGSPPYPQNVRDDDPNRKYPGYLRTNCTQEFTPLTTNQGVAVAATQTLSVLGNTYIPSGLAWGFNMLSKPAPMTEAAAYDPSGTNQRPRKALVLMTDGANSMKLVMPGGKTAPVANGTVATQANQYTLELCNNIKAAKIEIFAVAFAITDPVAKKLVADCATDAGHYYDATDNAALTTAFQSIADALQQMHISH